MSAGLDAFNNSSYIYSQLKSIAKIIGGGAGQVKSPFASAPFSSNNFVAAMLLLPTAQLIGFP